MAHALFIDTDDYSFGEETRQTACRCLQQIEPLVRSHLPMLAGQLTLTFYPGARVIPETGYTAFTPTKDWIQVTVNPHDDRGIEAILADGMPGCFAHEAHHAARYVAARPPFDGRVISSAVFEGLATAFEEEITGAVPPWGHYDDLADQWVTELLALPEGTNSRPWRFVHPDGRRWIAYRAGKRLADRAKLGSGKTAAQLVGFDTDTILRLASA